MIWHRLAVDKATVIINTPAMFCEKCAEYFIQGASLWIPLSHRMTSPQWKGIYHIHIALMELYGRVVVLEISGTMAMHLRNCHPTVDKLQQPHNSLVYPIRAWSQT